MKPRNKFLIGGALILSAVAFLAVNAVNATGVYYFTPTELSAKIAADSTFYDVGVKVGAHVVPGTIVRQPGGREVAFDMTDGTKTYNVVYRGIAPDTFTDSVEVVVEGRLHPDQVFHATVLLAKCASRYEELPARPDDLNDGYSPPRPGYAD